MSIVITHEGQNTKAVYSDGRQFIWVTRNVTYTDNTTHIGINFQNISLEIADIDSIDGEEPYGTAAQIIEQIRDGALNDNGVLSVIVNQVSEDSEGGGGVGYDVYTALLTQTGTDAPVATVLESTLGGTVVWTRDQAGVYTGTLAGAFTVGKTIIPPFTTYNGSSLPTIPFSDGGSITGYYQMWANSANNIRLNVFDASFVAVDLSDMTLLAETGDLLIDLKVYP